MLLDIKCSRSEIRKKPNRDTASLYQFTTDTFKNKKSVNQEKTKDAKTIEVTTSQRPKKKSEVRLSNKFSNRHCSAYQQRYGSLFCAKQQFNIYLCMTYDYDAYVGLRSHLVTRVKTLVLQ